jgi:transglutaminase superfamily protein
MIRKFWQLQWNDRLILVEAILMLALSVTVIAIMPFPYVGRLSSRRLGRAEPSVAERALMVSRVRWAVLASARRVPWRALCFEQGLAAQLMLRRRGIASALYFGVASSDPKGLAAHVWVRDGDVDIVGAESASEFTVLATFPSPSVDQSGGRNYVHRAGTHL